MSRGFAVNTRPFVTIQPYGFAKLIFLTKNLSKILEFY